MITEKYKNGIKQIIKSGHVYEYEPMSIHTSFKVGGAASFLVNPFNTDELKNLIKYLKENNIPYFVMGNGSNLLVSDKGYDGVVIEISDKNNTGFSAYNCSTNEKISITAGAGCSMVRIAYLCEEQGAGGFEALSGIPGCIGGAASMNAGAYDVEIKDVIKSVEVLTPDGELKELSNSDCLFRYRGSAISDNSYIVTKINFEFEPADRQEIKKRIAEYSALRAEKQPLDYPSAGSTFKRPEGYFAGKLISEAGLSGKTIGGAKVSEKHNGFIINKGNASADDIFRLVNIVIDTVYKNSGVKLEPEIKFLGIF